ncbi:hypothetical protein [Rhodococcus rhodochrous]|uniref:hypothetical protein n=1 Tax=Rhodococcus rhodochrous TaxID=1829 RepID=UPI0020B15EC3|nr:hypothetical protein [Rhodococcus rhodochrous]
MSTVESRPADHGAAPELAAYSSLTDFHGTSVKAQLARRRSAIHRLPPLECGCVDPWWHRCNEPGPSQRRTDALTAAAAHLLDVGLTPIMPVDDLRELWRRGGPERRLAATVAERVMQQ